MHTVDIAITQPPMTTSGQTTEASTQPATEHPMTTRSVPEDVTILQPAIATRLIPEVPTTIMSNGLK